MIASMTGFSSVSRELNGSSIVLEIRSLNHRYLDIQFRIHDEVKFAEPLIRERIFGELSRGKVDCRLSLNRREGSLSQGNIDQTMLMMLAEFGSEIRKVIPEVSPLSVADVLRWPGIFGSESLEQDALRSEIVDMLNIAMEEFSATRRREGEKLKAILVERMVEIRKKMA